MWDKDKIRIVEERDFNKVSKRCNNNGVGIVRAVSIWHEEILCGYFLTCEYEGVRSFHGFKFVKGGLEIQIPLVRKYIEEEKLEFSVYKTKETRAVLRILGFKDIGSKGEYTVTRKI